MARRLGPNGQLLVMCLNVVFVVWTVFTVADNHHDTVARLTRSEANLRAIVEDGFRDHPVPKCPACVCPPSSSVLSSPSDAVLTARERMVERKESELTRRARREVPGGGGGGVHRRDDDDSEPGDT